MCLLKCLKGPFSGNPLGVDVLTSPKHCWNLESTTCLLLCSLIWDRLSWKKLLLPTSELSGLSADILTVNDKYSLYNREIFPQQFQMPLTQKRKFFFNFSLRSWNIPQVLSISEKNMNLIAEVLPKLLTPKEVATEMSKSSFFRQTFSSQRVTCCSQTLTKSARYYFYTTVPLIWDKLSWKKLLLATSKMLGSFFNNLTDDGEYFRHNRENFRQQIQMLLSQKPNTFSGFSIVFLKSWSNSEDFEKKIWVSWLKYLQNYWLWMSGYLNV